MELTGKKLEEILDAELIGKDVGYSRYTFVGTAVRVIRVLAKEAGLNEDDFSSKEDGSTDYLTYKKVAFADISFKKQRGKYRYGSYEWTFKKCFVNLWNEEGYYNYKGLTFQEMLDKIDTNLVAEALAESKKLYKAKEIFQMIKEKINAKDDYEVVNFISYMNKNSYSIRQ